MEQLQRLEHKIVVSMFELIKLGSRRRLLMWFMWRTLLPVIC